MFTSPPTETDLDMIRNITQHPVLSTVIKEVVYDASFSSLICRTAYISADYATISFGTCVLEWKTRTCRAII